jgi:diamine N-acetyltransferase
MNNEVVIRHATTEDIRTIGNLAHQIWPITYGDTIERVKLQYMLKFIYHPDSLKEQMIKQQHVFLMADIAGAPVGFASFSGTDKESIYKLHKLYVRTDLQGMGLGKALTEAVIQEIKPMGAKILLLNVYRLNKAKAFYEKLGFEVIKEEDVDIGHGYFMNDYVMQKTL